MKYELRCTRCGSPSANLLDYKCHCGSPLEVRLDSEFDKRRIRKRNFSAWRYMEFYPYLDKKEIVSLGEGWTHIVKLKENLYLKLEFLNPTCSFKDRGSTTLISAIHRRVKKERGYISEDSSGNAGASIAAYASRSGLKARIYVPASVLGQKLNQILFYGAEVERVGGKRSEVAIEAQKPRRGKFYVGHIWHPIFNDGVRTLAYELAEQFEWRPPDNVYLPVSAGTLLLGVIRGFRHLMDSGLMDGSPRIVACQPEQVSPLHHKLTSQPFSPPKVIDSIADALVSLNPPFLDLMVDGLKKTGGKTEAVGEAQIYDAFVELAKNGFFVEPSSAVAYAAYKKHEELGQLSESQITVIVLTGSGLKSKVEPQ
ncbi:MAG: pyridoxal-phosphate dependent enzyme [Candidatus Hodarchaeota archaeon]